MANVLEIIIKGKDKASPAFKGVTGAAQKMAGTLGNVVKVAGVAATALGVGVAVGAVKATRGLADLALEALPLQGIRDAFQGITGDADTMLEALREGSLGMVRDADLMKSYNQAAQLVSKTFADQLPGAMQYLSKVSAATGEDMGYMMDSLVKGVGRMSPMILDNLGIQVSLAEATDRAAQMFGIEADELTKTQEQAGLMNVVMEKLAANTAAMPDVAGTAAQGWASLQITFQNLKDNVGLALIPVLQQVLEPLAALAQKVAPMVVAFVETKLVPAIQTVIDIAKEFTRGFIAARENGLGPLEQIIWGVTEALDNFLPEEVMDRVWDFMEKVISAKDAVFGFVNEQLIPFVTKHGPAIKAAIIAIVGAFTAMFIIAKVKALLLALTNPIGWIVLAIGVLAAAWTEDWGGIRTWLHDTWVNTLQPIFQAIVGWLQENIPKAIDAVGKAFQWFKDHILNPVAGAFNGIANAIGGVIDWIGRVADKIASIHLPSWLTPGSPTPFELGLKGIGDEMKRLATVNIPQFSMAMERAGQNVTNNRTTNNNFYLTGQYRYQSERTLTDEVRFLSASIGGVRGR